jgi:hypothetical protein
LTASGQGLTVGSGGLYDSFTTSGSGTFDAAPLAVIPEPSALLMASIATVGLAGFGLLRRRLQV